MTTGFWTRLLLTVGVMFALLNIGRSADPADNSSTFGQRVLELTNLERTKYGLKPLTLDEHLSGSATWKAKDMAHRNYFDHEDYPGHGFIERAKEHRYLGWRLLGENIAAGQLSPEEVVSAWMESPPHRKNILKPEYHEIGLGYSVEPHSEYQRYWVQEFGAK